MRPEKFGRYEIVEELGRGSMGIVYKAFDPVLKRHLAIKSMGAAARADKDFVARFFREAQATAGLNHTNIVSLYDIGEAESQPYIAIEFLEGQDLETILDKGVFIPFDRKLDIVVQLCRGLQHAHSRNVVHRDIKPSNVQITPRGEVKILDFGIAKLLSSNVTTTGQLMGTPSYMAPEQVSGASVDHRSDVFGTGVMLYQLVAGEKPFQGNDFRSVMYSIATRAHRPLGELLPACAAELAAIVDRALAKDPEERFQTAQELQDALLSFRAQIPHLVQDLRGKVAQLRQEIDGQQLALNTDAELSGVIEELLERVPKADPDRTVLGSDIEKETDYGYLLVAHKQLTFQHSALGLVASRQPELQELHRRCRELLEKEEWGDCLDSVEKVLAILPESKEALRLQKICQQRIDQTAEAPAGEPIGDSTADVLSASSLEVEDLSDRMSSSPLPEIPAEVVDHEETPTRPGSWRFALWAVPLAGVLLLGVAATAGWLNWTEELDAVSIYQARTGDSLDAVASRFGVGAQQLARANRIEASAPLIPGQILDIGGIPEDAATLVLDFAPWARLVSVVREADGAEILVDTAVTPVTLRLAPGSYIIRADNSELGSNVEFTIEVEAGAVQRDDRPMPGFDLGTELDSIFGKESD